MKASVKGDRFEVDLGELNLPPIIAKRIESDIRSTVLSAIAKLDTGGIRRIDWIIRDPFDPTTYGMILDPRGLDPFQPQAGSDNRLDVRDHEIVVDAVMKNAPQIIKILKINSKSEKPSGDKVLKAALEIEEIEESVKEIIKWIIDLLGKISNPERRLPTKSRKALAELKQRLSGKDLAEQVRVSRDADFCESLDDDQISAALPFAAQILEDGAGSIYSESNPFFEVFSGPKPSASKKDKVDGLKDTDYFGGVAGGAAGTVIPGVGTAAGAAGGAAAASAGYAIAWVIDSIFD